MRLRSVYPVLDMPEAVIRDIARPPASPQECIFARTTQTIAADLQTSITPCQFGGDPDCENCGCIATLGLAALGHHRVLGPLTAGHIMRASDVVGRHWRARTEASPAVERKQSPFPQLEVKRPS